MNRERPSGIRREHRRHGNSRDKSLPLATNYSIIKQQRRSGVTQPTLLCARAYLQKLADAPRVGRRRQGRAAAATNDNRASEEFRWSRWGIPGIDLRATLPRAALEHYSRHFSGRLAKNKRRNERVAERARPTSRARPLSVAGNCPSDSRASVSTRSPSSVDSVEG